MNTTEKNVAIQEMRGWFFKHYENPVDSCPYESSDGGYVYVWGGPYAASNVLYGEFGSQYESEWIDELVAELNEECDEWSGSSDQSEYENEVLSQILSITSPCEEFIGATIDVEKLLQQDVHDSVKSKYMQLLYVSVISSLEVYLSDTFIGLVNTHAKLMQRFVETYSDFNEKLKFSEIFTEYAKITNTVNSKLLEISWHNIAKVKPLYRGTLSIDLPELDPLIHQAILKRHDIVHRNGKTKDGVSVLVTKGDVEAIVDKCEVFVREVDELIKVIDVTNL